MATVGPMTAMISLPNRPSGATVTLTGTGTTNRRRFIDAFPGEHNGTTPTVTVTATIRTERKATGSPTRRDGKTATVTVSRTKTTPSPTMPVSVRIPTDGTMTSTAPTVTPSRTIRVSGHDPDGDGYSEATSMRSPTTEVNGTTRTATGTATTRTGPKATGSPTMQHAGRTATVTASRTKTTPSTTTPRNGTTPTGTGMATTRVGSGTAADRFPDDPSRWVDSRDGVADEDDAFPNDASQQAHAIERLRRQSQRETVAIPSQTMRPSGRTPMPTVRATMLTRSDTSNEPPMLTVTDSVTTPVEAAPTVSRTTPRNGPTSTATVTGTTLRAPTQMRSSRIPHNGPTLTATGTVTTQQGDKADLRERADAMGRPRRRRIWRQSERSDPYRFDFDNDGYNDSIDPLPKHASPGD